MRSIRMSVYNAVGEGPTSTPQEVFVGEAGKSQSEGVRLHTQSISLFLSAFLVISIITSTEDLNSRTIDYLTSLNYRLSDLLEQLNIY